MGKTDAVVCPSCGREVKQQHGGWKGTFWICDPLDMPGCRVNGGPLFFWPVTHSNRIRAEGLIQPPKGIPHYGCHYLGTDGEVCNKCGKLVKMADVPMTFARMIQEAALWESNCKELWEALRLIRSAVEELGPVGAVCSPERTVSPNEEALAILEGIKKMAAIGAKAIEESTPTLRQITDDIPF